MQCHSNSISTQRSLAAVMAAMHVATLVQQPNSTVPNWGQSFGSCTHSTPAGASACFFTFAVREPGKVCDLSVLLSSSV